MTFAHIALEVFFVSVGIFAVWAIIDSIRKVFK